MAKLIWDASGTRLFEFGLDRGVLYPDGEEGVPWNGLVSVDAGSDGVSSEAIYFNGRKTMDYVLPGDFSGKIKAITYPDKFLDFEGTAEQAPGVYLSNQPLQTFGMSYRTLIGNDTVGKNYGYKIHVLYNLTAIPESATYETLNDSVSPGEFGWDITGVPENLSGRRPTVHFTFYSNRMNETALEEIEKILYGTSSTIAHLPPLVDLLSFFTIAITDNGDGTWTASGPDHLITMLDADTFQIEDANSIVIDADTYIISST